MRILHILSQHQVTGAETYAVTLADKHIAMGHKVWIVSDTLNTPSQATYIQQAIGNRSWSQRLLNLIRIRKLIKQHKIEMVHSHSRAATWIGYFSTRFTKVGFISSVHGRQSLRISKRILDIYGKRVIAVCENIQDHLIKQLKMDPQKVCVIPNAIDFKLDDQLSLNFNQRKILSIVGRTSGPKGQRTAELISEVFPYLLQSIPELEIRIIGGELKQLPPESQIKLYQLQKAYPNRVQAIGFVSNLSTWLAESTCNIAAGRVAVESLLCQRPTVALGEADYEGLVSEANLKACIASNFGDVHAEVKRKALDHELIRQTLLAILNNPSRLAAELYENIQALYESQHIAEQVLDVYRSLRMQMQHSRHIPILMYHKVLNEERSSKHRIYVTVQRFHAHMQSLKNRQFTPITFKDYLSFR
ncbi:MAG: hypothetical protein K0S29_1376, partial [Gammaproteobacteria bacterium]|nr:hypothetical protein [Gammaproteobacteria bacterium]